MIFGCVIKRTGYADVYKRQVHMDEKTPHMHLCFVPLTEDGRLSATLQIWKLLDHVFPKLILPPGQLLFIAHDVFGAEPAVLRQRDKTKVHMGRFLVHMHHGGYNCLFGLMLFQKVQSFLEKYPNFRPFLSLKELRAGCEQDVYKRQISCCPV